MEKMIIGTYTHSVSEGIYTVELNKETEYLEKKKLIAKTVRPSYVDYNSQTGKLYSVLERDDKGGVAIWDYQPNDNEAVLEKEILLTGKAPCYVKYSQLNQLLYDAHFHDERVTLYNNETAISVWDYGEGSRPHFVDEHPVTKAIFVCDYGHDKILKYEQNKLVSIFEFPKETGPRNMCFHPFDNKVYVLGQLSNELFVLEDHGTRFESLQVVSTLENQEKSSDGAAVRISKDGKFIYASNRGEDTLVVFKTDQMGTLTFQQRISTFGEHPRDFSLSEDNQYCVVANLHTNNLVLYKRDKHSGVLEVIQKDFEIPEPTCVHFISKIGL